VNFTVSDLSPDAGQRMLAESVERFVADHYAHPDWRRRVDADPGISEVLWRQMAELGWLGLSVPEERGGHGGSFADLLQVLERLGQGLVTEPVASTIAVAADLLAQSQAAVARECLPAVVSGDLRLVLAHDERLMPEDPAALSTCAVFESGRWRLSGQKWMVADAPHAQRLIVSARVADRSRAPGGVALFLLPVDRTGVRVDALRCFDRRRAAHLRFDAVNLSADERLDQDLDARAILARAEARRLAACAAESLGISARLLKTTREYLMTREQFGAKLASFQVLQHRMVDLFIDVEDLRTLARIAAIAAQLPDLRTLEATRVKLIQTLPAVGRQAVQLHGGVGMSDEYHVGDCMKRLEAIALSCGRIEQALDRFAATASPGISVHP
jgi:alkylation response protein AidB-like acyl-CoA dehydrogenase